jgi:hypothetical protein
MDEKMPRQKTSSPLPAGSSTPVTSPTRCANASSVGKGEGAEVAGLVGSAVVGGDVVLGVSGPAGEPQAIATTKIVPATERNLRTGLRINSPKEGTM